MKKTIIDLFEDSVVKYGAKTFLLEKKHRAFEPTTYAETKEQALEIGAGLAIVDEPFTEQNGLVNSTMKVVRNKVEEHFRDRLEYLYTPEGRDLKNPKNLASLKKIVD